jgi:FkbM family methyltransferase
MYEKFHWTEVGRNRNRILEEYEPLQPYLLVALADAIEAGAFLDIGANTGAYTVFMSQVPSVRQMSAFEANPATADELARNLALNGLTARVAVHRCALSETAGSIAFGIVDAYSGANAVLDSAFQDPAKFKESITVDAVPLDDLLPDPLPGTVAVKLDVEGHEAMVLRGARKTFAQNRMLVQIELYPQGREAVVEELAGLGYRRLLRIGPDNYYTNIPELTEAQVLDAFGRASDGVIARSHARGQEAAGDVRSNIRLSGGIALQLSGGAAKFAKRVRRIFGG